MTKTTSTNINTNTRTLSFSLSLSVSSNTLSHIKNATKSENTQHSHENKFYFFYSLAKMVCGQFVFLDLSINKLTRRFYAAYANIHEIWDAVCVLCVYYLKS